MSILYTMNILCWACSSVKLFLAQFALYHNCLCYIFKAMRITLSFQSSCVFIGLPKGLHPIAVEEMQRRIYRPTVTLNTVALFMKVIFWPIHFYLGPAAGSRDACSWADQSFFALFHNEQVTVPVDFEPESSMKREKCFSADRKLMTMQWLELYWCFDRWIDSVIYQVCSSHTSLSLWALAVFPSSCHA